MRHQPGRADVRLHLRAPVLLPMKLLRDEPDVGGTSQHLLQLCIDLGEGCRGATRGNGGGREAAARALAALCWIARGWRGAGGDG